MSASIKDQVKIFLSLTFLSPVLLLTKMAENNEWPETSDIQEIGQLLSDICSRVDGDNRRTAVICICNVIQSLGSLEDDDYLDILESLYPREKFWSNALLSGHVSTFLERGSLNCVAHLRNLLTLTEEAIRANQVEEPAWILPVVNPPWDRDEGNGTESERSSENGEE